MKIAVGEILLGRGLTTQRENEIASGFKVIAVLENGVRVRRIHYSYLVEGREVESWIISNDNLKNFNVLPVGTQMPLL